VYPDRRWTNPIADGTPDNPGGPFDLAWLRKAGGYRDLDTRIWFFTDYYSLSPGMISQIPGSEPSHGEAQNVRRKDVTALASACSVCLPRTS